MPEKTFDIKIRLTAPEKWYHEWKTPAIFGDYETTAQRKHNKRRLERIDELFDQMLAEKGITPEEFDAMEPEEAVFIAANKTDWERYWKAHRDDYD